MDDRPLAIHLDPKLADLRDRLVAHGFEVDETEALMVLDLEDAPFPGPIALPADVTVRRLESAAELVDVRRIEETVWGQEMPWVTESLAADLALPGYLSVYAADVDGQPACAAWMYFHANGQFADLWGGATLPEHRGKGLFTAILAARVQEAAERGYRFVTIDAGPMSRPIVERRSFRFLTMVWGCRWQS